MNNSKVDFLLVLSAKQRLNLHNIRDDGVLVDLNATQAAIRAGYSEKTAYSMGHENLQKLKLRAYFSKLMKLRSLRTQVTGDRVLEELGKIAFAKEGVKPKDKLKALEMLAKHIDIKDELIDFEKEARLGRQLKKLCRDIRKEQRIGKDAARNGSDTGDNGEHK